MAMIQTNVAAITNRIARKYLAGIIKISASGNNSTLMALKQQIVRAQRSPRLTGSAQ
jgi:hypothetical protein